MNNVLTIYGTLLSANVRKVLATAKALNIDFEFHSVNVYQGEGQSPEFLALNPMGQIPVVVDGDLTLRESNAILLYLANKSGDKGLLGRTPDEQALIAQWLFWESSQWQPMLAGVMAGHVGHRLLPDVVPAPSQTPDWQNQSCIKLLSILEANLAEHFLVGKSISLADFSVAAMTTYFYVCDFPFDAYPNLTTWLNNLKKLPGWADTLDQTWR